MGKNKVKTVIQVPIEQELLEHIDQAAGSVAQSRAAFVREACRLRLRSLEERELERRYVEGYRKKPEKTRWAEVGAALLSRVLPDEKW